MLSVIYHLVAAEELREAFAWYEMRERGLGSEFIRCIDKPD